MKCDKMQGIWYTDFKTHALNEWRMTIQERWDHITGQGIKTTRRWEKWQQHIHHFPNKGQTQGDDPCQAYIGQEWQEASTNCHLHLDERKNTHPAVRPFA